MNILLIMHNSTYAYNAFMLLYNYVRFYPMFPIFAKRAHTSESGPSADVSAAAPKRPKSNPDCDVEDAIYC